MSIAAAMEGGSSDDALVRLANDTQHPGSGAALWMLLLLRLTAVTTDQRLELRNSKPAHLLLLRYHILTIQRCRPDIAEDHPRLRQQPLS